MSAPPLIKTQLVPIDSVRPDPKNAREHNERNLSTIVESLRRFSQRTPIVVDRDGVIRKGTGTWLAAKREGWTKLNVTFTELSADEASKYAIADNRTGDLSYFDERVLAEALRPLGSGELLAIGFDQAEAAEIFEAASDELPAADPHKSQGHQGVVSVRVLIAVHNVELLERALAATGKMNREAALLEVCQHYVGAHEKAMTDAGA